MRRVSETLRTVAMSQRHVGHLVAAGDAGVDVEDLGARLVLLRARPLMNSASRAVMASPTCLRVPLIDSPTSSIFQDLQYDARDQPERASQREAHSIHCG